MQQYGVPQFTDIEDKIVGPFTIKQFLVVIGGAAVILVYWLLFQLGLVFFVLAIPTAVLTLVISLGSANGRSILTMFFPALGFFAAPRRMVFHRGGTDQLVQIQTKVKPAEDDAMTTDEVKGRLNRLAYVLDQKSALQKQLEAGQSNNQTPRS